jgi:riboflavin kinase/FMN adenylyltransferase
MKRIYIETLDQVPVLSKKSVVTLGVFDGMHQGHLCVLDRVCETGKRLNADKVVITFGVHPENLLNSHAPEMILTLEHRLRLMERAGMDLAIVIPFDDTTRNTPAERFLVDFLVGSLNCKAIVLGHDSAFGKNREGNYEFLNRLRDDYGYEVHQAPEVKVRDDIISSTRIREAIRSGDLPLVEEMLGRELSVLGKVVPGDGRGRTIGFPTANLDCHHAILPPLGVYAVKVLHNGILRRGVMNIGTRPTFHEGKSRSLLTVEVHLPNFNGDLYGTDMEVFITRKIRNEKRFKSVEELKDAIQKDIASLGR